MPNIHELLEQSQRQAEELVKQLEDLESSRDINLKAAENLDAVCKSIAATQRAIKPLTEKNIRLAIIVALSLGGINLLLFTIILIAK